VGTLRGGAGVTCLAMAGSGGATLSGGAGANGLAGSVSRLALVEK
jgi:hypothetical protein